MATTTKRGLNKPDRADYVSVITAINNNMDNLDDAVSDTMIAPPFVEATPNAAGSYVTNAGALYYLPNGHTANTTWENTSKTEVKVGSELTKLNSAVVPLIPSATSGDVGKFLKAKTVSGGKVTEYEFGTASGGGAEIDDDAGEGDTDVVWSADKTWTETEELKEAIASQKPPVEYKFSGTDLLLGFGFSSTLDYVIVMNNGRANGLFDFAKLCTKAHGTSLENLATADLTVVWNSGTDMHSPFQFLAVNDADGYHSEATTAGFTGGNHTLDSLGTGFETASSIYVKFYADGIPVSSGNGRCSAFEIRWANDVQAYNTVKQGGGGRACLREYHDMIFDGVNFKEKITLKALEEIKMSWYDGFQCVSIGTTYDNIAFVDGSNRGTFDSSDSNIDSGNATTSGLIAWGDTHRIEMFVDTGVDLGKRTFYSGTKGAYVSSYGKGYFSIVGQTMNVNAGDMFYLDGGYRFLPQVSTESKPCTGITLNKDEISFDTLNDTETLIATTTPADTTDVITWSTSDSTVATVNGGIVTAKANGTATITATCGQHTATCDITVNVSQEKPCTAISLDKETLSFDSAEETKTITATLTPSDTTDALTWSSSDNNVATVSNGVVTIHGIGTATITATCGEQTATASVIQTTIKAPYELKTVTDKVPDPHTLSGESFKLLRVATTSGQNSVGQAYHGIDNVRVENGQLNDIECVKVPYGATVVKIKTSDDVAVTISYWYKVDASDVVTYNNVNYPKFKSNASFFNTNNGASVEYGEAVMFRPTSAQSATLCYIYFE